MRLDIPDPTPLDEAIWALYVTMRATPEGVSRSFARAVGQIFPKRIEAANAQAWRRRNPEKVAIYKRAFYRAHPEKVAEVAQTAKAWKKANRAKESKRTLAYYHAHRERAATYARAYHLAHREAINARHQSTRKTRKEEAGVN
jgi:ABC-type nitrate/sulfonate/bicarbonate transport system substrate-binding protein